jgi:hypothetical protein
MPKVASSSEYKWVMISLMHVGTWELMIRSLVLILSHVMPTPYVKSCVNLDSTQLHTQLQLSVAIFPVPRKPKISCTIGKQIT